MNTHIKQNQVLDVDRSLVQRASSWTINGSTHPTFLRNKHENDNVKGEATFVDHLIEENIE